MAERFHEKIPHFDERLNYFPLSPNSKSPIGEMKDRNHLYEKIPLEELKSYIEKYPDCNIGVACGEASNKLVVIDFDLKYKNAWTELEKIIQKEFPIILATKIVSTPHGYHVYFFLDETVVGRSLNTNLIYKNVTNKKTDKKEEVWVGVVKTRHPEFLRGLDILGHGGYALNEGSIIDDKKYESYNDKDIVTISTKTLNQIKGYFLLEKPRQLREGFSNFLTGKENVETYSARQGKDEHIYWKYLFIESWHRLGLVPSELYPFLERNQPVFDRKKTEQQLKHHPYTDQPLTNEKYAEYFPDYHRIKALTTSLPPDTQIRESRDGDTLLDVFQQILEEDTIYGDGYIFYAPSETISALYPDGVPRYDEVQDFVEQALIGEIFKFMKLIMGRGSFDLGLKLKFNANEAKSIASRLWAEWFIRDKLFVMDKEQPDIHHTYFFEPKLKIIILCFDIKSVLGFQVEYRSEYIDQSIVDHLGYERMASHLYQAILRDSKKESKHVRVVKIHKTSYYNNEDIILYISDRFQGYYKIDDKGYLSHHDNSENDIFFEFYKDIKGMGGGHNERILLDEIKEKDKKKWVDFRDFLNDYEFDISELTKEEWMDLIYCNLLTMYFEPEVKPIFKLVGEAGSGKSYLMGNCVAFVTHSKVDKTTINEEKPEDLQIAASHSRMVPWDNVTKISNEMANAMCIISTGGIAAKRELYTTHSIATFDIRAYLWLSTTVYDLGLWREDLAERMIHVFLEKIKKKIINAKQISIFSEKERYLQMFGSMFEHLKVMILNVEKIEPSKLSRLDDWTRMMKAASIAIGRSTSYMENILQKENTIKQRLMAEGEQTVEPLLVAFGTGRLQLGKWYKTKEILDALIALPDNDLVTSGKYGTTTRSLAGTFKKKRKMFESLGLIVERSDKLFQGSYRWKFTHIEYGEDQESYQQDYDFGED